MQGGRQPLLQLALGIGDQRPGADQGRHGDFSRLAADFKQGDAGLRPGEDRIDRQSRFGRRSALEAYGPERQRERSRQHGKHQHHSQSAPFHRSLHQPWPEAIEACRQGRGQGDGHQVGHEQEEGAAGDPHVAGAEAETHRRDRRHQGGGDGHANDRLAALLDHRIGAGDAGKDRDQQVEEIGARPRQNLGRRFLQRRQDGQDHGDDQGEAEAQCQGPQRPVQLAEVQEGQ